MSSRASVRRTQLPMDGLHGFTECVNADVMHRAVSGGRRGSCLHLRLPWRLNIRRVWASCYRNNLPASMLIVDQYVKARRGGRKESWARLLGAYNRGTNALG